MLRVNGNTRVAECATKKVFGVSCAAGADTSKKTAASQPLAAVRNC
jgi:hypothetical protein